MDLIDRVGSGLSQAVSDLAERLPLILLGFLVFLGFAVLSQVVQGAIRHGRLIKDDSLRALVAGLVSGALIAFGVAFGLIISLPGVSFAELIASLGVGGIILGFALRDILENFVAGIIILARRPFVVGDQIRSGEHEGTVTEINFRSTVVRTYDGFRVFIPNGPLLTQPVENLTSYGERRSEISLAIHQGASVAEARRTILRELASMDEVLSDPSPEVLFDTIGESSNNLRVLFWSRPPTRTHQRTLASEVTERLYRALTEVGIEFPYPIQTIRIDRSRPDR
ncbi:MAG: mechanosensitive ion channel family protein [Candidatus Limnocylindrales bacterium]